MSFDKNLQASAYAKFLIFLDLLEIFKNEQGKFLKRLDVQ